MRWARHEAHMGTMRNSYKILVGKHEGKEKIEYRDIGGLDSSGSV
jgi:hypothetical protein